MNRAGSPRLPSDWPRRLVGLEKTLGLSTLDKTISWPIPFERGLLVTPVASKNSDYLDSLFGIVEKLSHGLQASNETSVTPFLAVVSPDFPNLEHLKERADKAGVTLQVQPSLDAQKHK